MSTNISTEKLDLAYMEELVIKAMARRSRKVRALADEYEDIDKEAVDRYINGLDADVRQAIRLKNKFRRNGKLSEDDLEWVAILSMP